MNPAVDSANSRASAGGGSKGEVPPVELRAITLIKSKTEEWRTFKNYFAVFFLLVLFKGETN